MSNKMQLTPEEMQNLEKQGFKNAIPALLKLESAGDACKGEFVESGMYTATDPKTGEIKEIPYYVFRGDEGVFRLNGLTILDKGLSGVKAGQVCIIIRKPDVKTISGRKATDFAVFIK